MQNVGSETPQAGIMPRRVSEETDRSSFRNEVTMRQILNNFTYYVVLVGPKHLLGKFYPITGHEGEEGE